MAEKIEEVLRKRPMQRRINLILWFQLKKDVTELQSLEAQATRHRVKDVLSLEARKLSSEIIKLQEQLNTASKTPTPNTAAPVKRYQVKLNNYGKSVVLAKLELTNFSQLGIKHRSTSSFT
jgi:hypothetical protein